MIAKAPDLVRFALAIDAGTILSADTHDRMTAPYQLADGTMSEYALGWRISTDEMGTWVAHSGGATGGSTRLLRLPERGVAVAVFSNVQMRRAFPRPPGASPRPRWSTPRRPEKGHKGLERRLQPAPAARSVAVSPATRAMPAGGRRSDRLGVPPGEVGRPARGQPNRLGGNDPRLPDLLLRPGAPRSVGRRSPDCSRPG